MVDEVVVIAHATTQHRRQAGRIDHGQGVIAGQTVYGNLRDAGEGHGRAAVDRIAAAVGAGDGDDDGVVSTGAVNRQDGHAIRSPIQSC
jgi:hypothetical protein